MKLLFATTNPAKIAKFVPLLTELGYEVLTLKDLDIDIDIDETGKDAVENAVIKARGYYDIAKMPTISMDNILFLDGIPSEKQPGCFVRRVNGKVLTDDEMIEYYTSLVHEFGGKVKAQWIYGMAICTGDETFTYTWSKKHFYFMDSPSVKRNPGYPLDSISFIPEFDKYMLELTEDERREHKAHEKPSGVDEFLKSTLSNLNKEKIGSL